MTSEANLGSITVCCRQQEKGISSNRRTSVKSQSSGTESVLCTRQYLDFRINGRRFMDTMIDDAFRGQSALHKLGTWWKLAWQSQRGVAIPPFLRLRLEPQTPVNTKRPPNNPIVKTKTSVGSLPVSCTTRTCPFASNQHSSLSPISFVIEQQHHAS